MIERSGGENSFIEVFVDCPVGECEKRDVKGLYAKARRGEILQFTGVDDPYEEPLKPEVRIRTHEMATEQGVAMIVEYLEAHSLL